MTFPSFPFYTNSKFETKKIKNKKLKTNQMIWQWKIENAFKCHLQRTLYIYIIIFVYSLHTRTFYWILFKTRTPVYLHPHRNIFTVFFSSCFSHSWLERNNENEQYSQSILLHSFFFIFFNSHFHFTFIWKFDYLFWSTSTQTIAPEHSWATLCTILDFFGFWINRDFD